MNSPVCSRWTQSPICLLAGATLANFGSWIDFLAILTLAAYTFKATPYEMAAVSASALFPAIVLKARIGRWCNSAQVGRLLVLSMLLRAAVTAALIGITSLPAFIAAVLLRSLFSAIIVPSENVIATRVVASDHVSRYFARISLSNNLSKIVAPAVGAALASVYGESNALLCSIALTLSGLVMTLTAIGTKRLPLHVVDAPDLVPEKRTP